MNYVKSCLIITMLLGIGYSQDCDPEANVGYNCDCNEDTWQEYYNTQGQPMEGCYLSGANLQDANLSYADLAWADLSGANLGYANLTSTNLSHANLNSTNLSHANLTEANLTDATIQSADLTWADLSGAFLDHPNLYGTNLCNLTGSYLGECEQPEGITDENGDGYDDVSYEAGTQSGDANLDGDLNVLDIVLYANMILNP